MTYQSRRKIIEVRVGSGVETGGLRGRSCFIDYLYISLYLNHLVAVQSKGRRGPKGGGGRGARHVGARRMKR